MFEKNIGKKFEKALYLNESFDKIFLVDIKNYIMRYNNGFNFLFIIKINEIHSSSSFLLIFL